MSKRVALFALALLYSPAYSQQPVGPLTDQRIMELVRAGVRPDELARIIASAPEVNFYLTPGAQQIMMSAGVTEETLKQMSAREQNLPSDALKPAVAANDTGQPSAVLDQNALSKLANWQDAVLVDLRTNQSGSACSSSETVNGVVDDSGDVRGRPQGSSNCVVAATLHYTLSVGAHTYIIQPDHTAGKKATVAATLGYGAVATLGYGAFFLKNSVLDNQLPGVHVLVRADPKGFWVKVGNRESKYRVVEAR